MGRDFNMQNQQRVGKWSPNEQSRVDENCRYQVEGWEITQRCSNRKRYTVAWHNRWVIDGWVIRWKTDTDTNCAMCNLDLSWLLIPPRSPTKGT